MKLKNIFFNIYKNIPKKICKLKNKIEKKLFYLFKSKLYYSNIKNNLIFKKQKRKIFFILKKIEKIEKKIKILEGILNRNFFKNKKK